MHSENECGWAKKLFKLERILLIDVPRDDRCADTIIIIYADITVEIFFAKKRTNTPFPNQFLSTKS